MTVTSVQLRHRRSYLTSAIASLIVMLGGVILAFCFQTSAYSVIYRGFLFGCYVFSYSLCICIPIVCYCKSHENKKKELSVLCRFYFVINLFLFLIKTTSTLVGIHFKN